MAVSPLVTNNFLDSCAFDPKYEPEDKAAQEIYRLYESGKLLLQIAYSTKKEIEHPNTPRWVKDAASMVIYTLDVNLTPLEVELLRRIETILAGAGTVENIVQDARHIFEAQKYGSYFVTADGRILKRAKELSSICSVAIMKPSEFLVILQDHIQEESELWAETTGNLNRSSVTPPPGHSIQLVSYKGYQIKPAPRQLRYSLRWTTNLTILINKGYEIVERQFFAANTFESEEEAIRACVEFGQQIIDGRIPNCTVTDL